MRRSYRLPLPDGRVLELGPRTLVMGVLNVTPDSFSDGGLHLEAEDAIDAGAAMIDAGADILDVGGESTRPGASPVSGDEERRRVVPVVTALARRGAVVSIDTTKSEVAAAAVEAGASLVNDISGLLYDPAIARVAASSGAALLLMHTRGRPSEMYAEAHYDTVIADVARELGQRILEALDAGVRRESLLIDPGIGFGKRAEHSFTVLGTLDAGPLQQLDRPIVIGPSRKSFLEGAIGRRPAAERDWATAAAVTLSAWLGAHVVRVHRVAEMAEVVKVADAVRAARGITT